MAACLTPSLERSGLRSVMRLTLDRKIPSQQDGIADTATREPLPACAPSAAPAVDPTWTATQLHRLQSKRLTELHAHLLGMGSARFWIEELIASSSVMPPNEDFLSSPDWDKDADGTLSLLLKPSRFGGSIPPAGLCLHRPRGVLLRLELGPLLYLPSHATVSKLGTDDPQSQHKDGSNGKPPTRMWGSTWDPENYSAICGVAPWRSKDFRPAGPEHGFLDRHLACLLLDYMRFPTCPALYAALWPRIQTFLKQTLGPLASNAIARIEEEQQRLCGLGAAGAVDRATDPVNENGDSATRAPAVEDKFTGDTPSGDGGTCSDKAAAGSEAVGDAATTQQPTAATGTGRWNMCLLDLFFAPKNLRLLAKHMADLGLNFARDFSYDVVFPIDDLSCGLGIRNAHKESHKTNTLDECVSLGAEHNVAFTKSRNLLSRDLVQSFVEEKLGCFTAAGARAVFQTRIVFNARKQEFEVVYGIACATLRDLIGGNHPRDSANLTTRQRDARAHVINAFSMCNSDGSEPRSVDFHAFRGSFTPEFYPRRFVLKDALYGQRLDVLAALLSHVLNRYAACQPAVEYCELSVGVGDLSRPAVVNVLLALKARDDAADQPNSHACFSSFRALLLQKHFPWIHAHLHRSGQVDSAACRLQYNVEYRFLVAFQRQQVRNDMLREIGYDLGQQEKAISLLCEWPGRALRVMQDEVNLSIKQKPTAVFKPLEDELDCMERVAALFVHYFDVVVGLDLCGDEMGYPYVPFVSHKFVSFVLRQRQHGRLFGVRVHCAENVPVAADSQPNYRSFIAHMCITLIALRYLRDRLECGIRVGHGVAFSLLLTNDTEGLPGPITVGTGPPGSLPSLDAAKRTSKFLQSYIVSEAKKCFGPRPGSGPLAVEVNATSNFYLLPDTLRSDHPYAVFDNLQLLLGAHVVLSTDDDGVWPIDHCPLGHAGHFSLAGELCRLICRNETGYSPQISPSLTQRLAAGSLDKQPFDIVSSIERSREHRFGTVLATPAPDPNAPCGLPLASRFLVVDDAAGQADKIAALETYCHSLCLTAAPACHDWFAAFHFAFWPEDVMQSSTCAPTAVSPSESQDPGPRHRSNSLSPKLPEAFVLLAKVDHQPYLCRFATLGLFSLSAPELTLFVSVAPVARPHHDVTGLWPRHLPVQATMLAAFQLVIKGAVDRAIRPLTINVKGFSTSMSPFLNDLGPEFVDQFPTLQSLNVEWFSNSDKQV